ncbi:MAG TPA: TraR/DksA family transcriptional regulator [Candidatus Saccharicenans sp.]|jgi:DnaK suppressor protein|nr:TraR/DksA family transcriptional regulator [Candidatus Saccharicenans sp.]HOJ26015.1 TraR/DksA family transcriptional regulator [Candidatus Saccharicenans sp.]HOL45218.1 TraR/DksA family transcriptional regulator [Candidatus Saccharicenans sp.]HOM93745.1 TraR/DksA family transcriptional regulator [Candidatus Saccharicenans sp.]HOT68952.1 TraR/DksA family transcriptional regulator [Candidatus Saccharicenans sp.]
MPEKLKLSKKEKEEYRKLLLERKNSIIRKLSQFYHESKEIETDTALDVADKAETSYTKEFLLGLTDSEREQLQLIDQALERLEKGEYGLCQVCHQEIGKKRLQIIPWTPYCINCQEKIERGVSAK